jgi:O-antigen/teichoic acid export membrane protein
MIASATRANQEGAARHFKKSRLPLLVVCSVMAVAFIAGGNWIVALLLGPKYVMAGWILQLLGFRAAWELFTSGTTQMLFALGSSKYAAFGNLLRLGFLAVGLTIAFRSYGFREAVWVLALSPIAAYVPLFVGLYRRCKSAMRVEFATASALLLTSAAAALLVRAF